MPRQTYESAKTHKTISNTDIVLERPIQGERSLPGCRLHHLCVYLCFYKRRSAIFTAANGFASLTHFDGCGIDDDCEPYVN